LILIDIDIILIKSKLRLIPENVNIFIKLLNHVKTRKRGNCECIATWGRPSHASPLPL